MPLHDSWIECALRITGHFEDSSDPLAAVSGDFDNQGLSLGVLQWNIGSGSLQPIVKSVGRDSVVAAMPTFGRELWTACTTPIPQGLTLVRGWQSNARVRPPVLTELKTLLRSASCVACQVDAARDVAQRAHARAAGWFGREPTLPEFSWFFDLFTQNGGLKDVSPQSVNDFVTAAGADRADDLVCDWLEGRPPTLAGFKDSRRNGPLWRNNVPAAKMSLFVASYLRSQKANPEWRADVLNRKGTIALGVGWVHLEQHDLNPVWNAVAPLAGV
jgi:hypothetical protein